MRELGVCGISHVWRGIAGWPKFGDRTMSGGYIVAIGMMRTTTIIAGRLVVPVLVARSEGMLDEEARLPGGRRPLPFRAGRYLMSRLSSRNSGVPASAIHSNTTISLSTTSTPCARIRSKASARRSGRREPTASAITATS